MIQIFTKKGKKGFHPYVSAGYGRYKTKEMAAGVSAGNDSTSFALNLSGMNTDAFSAFVPNDSAGANDTKYLMKIPIEIEVLPQT